MKTIYLHLDTNKFHSDQFGEPRAVRIAWALDDEEPRVHVIAPIEGQTWDQKAVQHHGITAEVAADRGVPLEEVAPLVLNDFEEADRVAAYSADFHRRQLDRALGRVGYAAQLPWACMMKDATKICQLPRLEPGGGVKYPKLWEAYEIILGRAPPPLVAGTSSGGVTFPADPFESGKLVINAVRALDKAIHG